MSRPKGCRNCGKPFSKPINRNGTKPIFCSKRCKSYYHISLKRGYKLQEK
ncbi:MAG: hypothetical protein AABY32_03085 [Nanoarchaeota archaeon]